MLEDVLDEFLTIDGVSAAVIVGKDGVVIERATGNMVNVDGIGSMVSTCLGSSEVIGGTLALGELQDMTVELDKGPVYLAPLTCKSSRSLLTQRGRWGMYGPNCRRTGAVWLQHCNGTAGISRCPVGTWHTPSDRLPDG